MKIAFLGNFSVDYSSESHHAATLELMGHEVIRLQEGDVYAESVLEQALQSSLFIWIHTHGWVTPGGMDMGEVLKQLKKSEIPTITYHLDLWLGIQREKDLYSDPFYRQIGHFFATDKLMADWFNENTKVKGHYLEAGVYEPETIILEESIDLAPEVAFIGSKGYHPEYLYRPMLINWLGETYKERFGHYSGEEGTLGLKRGLHLNQLLADTKVIVGDSLNIDFEYPWYWSDRLYEITGRGGFMIFPYIKGIEDSFDIGTELVTYEYGDFAQLKFLIDYYLEHDVERESIRKAGYERAKRDHTYTNRWQTILKELKL